MNVYYTYTEHHVSGGEALSAEEWSDRSDAHYEWTLKDVYATAPEHTPYNSSAPVGSFVKGKWVDGTLSGKDEAFVVVVRYSTGDTFGTSMGHGTVACICTDGKSAAAAVAAIQNGQVPKGREYAPWQGYFERLEGVHCEHKIAFG
jgi:hypothetical protein